MAGIKYYKHQTAANICAAVVIILLVLLIKGCVSGAESTAQVQKNMTEYMKNTYGKDFVVERPKSTGNEGFGYAQHVAKAYPVDQKDLKISVTWDKDTGEYTDTYLATKWTKQGTEEMNKKLKAIYGDNFRLDDYQLHFSDKSLKDLNYNDIINKYAYAMSIDLSYYVFLDGEIDRRFEAERAYKMLKDNFIDIDPTSGLQYFFSVEYIKKGQKAAFDELYSKTKDGYGARGPDDLYEAGILEDWIRIDYTPSLKDEYPEMKNAAEVEKRFRIFNNITVGGATGVTFDAPGIGQCLSLEEAARLSESGLANCVARKDVVGPFHRYNGVCKAIKRNRCQ